MSGLMRKCYCVLLCTADKQARQFSKPVNESIYASLPAVYVMQTSTAQVAL